MTELANDAAELAAYGMPELARRITESRIAPVLRVEALCEFNARLPDLSASWAGYDDAERAVIMRACRLDN